MISIRHSTDTHHNAKLRALPRRKGETNSAWIARSGIAGGILLIGGSSGLDFRLRVAQSHMRSDLLPSLWSQTGLLLAPRGGAFLSAPLVGHADPALIPSHNAVETCRLRDYDDPDRYPNLALIDFGGDVQSVARRITAIAAQRSIVDLVSLLVPWLGFAWGAGRQGNPLFESNGIPSAVLVETAYGIEGIELTPGLSSQTSCPEAIWQSARWWSSYYERAAAEPTRNAAVPVGCFVLDQPAAAVHLPARRAPRRRRA
ncbi:MAG: hypothetical protein ABI629_18285 [bacterium]